MATLVSNPRIDALLRELTQPDGRDDPYPRYAAIREEAPFALAEDGAVVLTRFADCSAALRNPACGRADPDDVFGPLGLNWREHVGIRQFLTSMLTINPPDHTRIRRLVSGVFTARRVAALRPAVTTLVDALVERLDGDVDFVDTFAFPLPVAVVGELLGVPEQDRAMFQPLVRDWLMLLDVFTPDILDRADESAGQIRDYLAGLAEERRRSPRKDLMSALVAVEAEGDRLTADELLTTAALLFAAGFETTTHLLGNGLVALLEHPDQLELLRTTPGIAGSAVEELLRYDSPVQISGRTILEDTHVNGLPVSAGTPVVSYLGAGNRDPERFEDPDRLDLTRVHNSPLSFGGGSHYCLGAPLARLEAEIALPAVVRHSRHISPTRPPQRRPGLTLRGYVQLPLSFG